MTGAALAGILTAVAGVITAVTALLHSIQTRKQVGNAAQPPAVSNTRANTGP